MNPRTLLAFVRSDLRLSVREPVLALFAVVVPTGLLLALGLPSFSHDPAASGGRAMVEASLPSLVICISVLLVGVFGVPTFLAAHREAGMLRRLATTPARPVVVLLSQLVINVAGCLAAVTLLLVVGWTAVGVPLPVQPLALAAAILLGLTATLGLGLVVAAVAPSPGVANVLCQLVVQPSCFLAGLYVPSEVLPRAVVAVGRATPAGALRQAIETAQLGRGALLAPLAILAAWSVASVAVAARVFRWQ